MSAGTSPDADFKPYIRRSRRYLGSARLYGPVSRCRTSIMSGPCVDRPGLAPRQRRMACQDLSAPGYNDMWVTYVKGQGCLPHTGSNRAEEQAGLSVTQRLKDVFCRRLAAIRSQVKENSSLNGSRITEKLLSRRGTREDFPTSFLHRIIGTQLTPCGKIRCANFGETEVSKLESRRDRHCRRLTELIPPHVPLLFPPAVSQLLPAAMGTGFQKSAHWVRTVKCTERICCNAVTCGSSVGAVSGNDCAPASRRDIETTLAFPQPPAVLMETLTRFTGTPGGQIRAN
ncbi:hypothetical protein Bbelb_090770 [Branchiostoma belcheri]|nr:hypothetical protein Bbelb_090770 [Branchiostoma belcheri]